jgi:hypothetical protein
VTITANQLLNMIKAEIADGGGEDIIYVEINGYVTPLADIEPELKGLYFIGKELPKS